MILRSFIYCLCEQLDPILADMRPETGNFDREKARIIIELAFSREFLGNFAKVGEILMIGAQIPGLFQIF